jgi:urease accessory protein
VTVDALNNPITADEMTAMPADLVFAGNRARGQVGLVVDCVAGISRRRRVHESGSLRVRFPGTPADELEAVLLNTAGGIAGGDAFDIDVSVAENARLVFTTAAAEKIYRSLGPPAVVNVRIDVASGASVAWLPQGTILFEGAGLSRRIDVTLAGSARLLLVEPIVFGRTGMGEVMRRGTLQDRWRVRRDGRLIYAEGTSLDGDISHSLAETAVARSGVAIATALIVPGDESLADAIRASGEFQGDVGVSAWNGITAVRFCASDGAALHRDMASALRAVRAAPLPRLWIT